MRNYQYSDMKDIKLLKIGEKATISGFYACQRPGDGKIGCNLTSKERITSLYKDKTAPSVNYVVSCNMEAVHKK